MSNTENKIIEAQIRECFGRVVWTHKTQEKCADILNAYSTKVKNWQLGLSVLITSGILVSIFGDLKPVAIIVAILSAGLSFLNSYLKSFDPAAVAEKHAQAAIQIWHIRESYLSLLTDYKAGKLSDEEVRVKRDELQNALFEVYKGSPRTISEAYNVASKALKTNEEMTFSDSEIDAFLPKELKKSNDKLIKEPPTNA